MKKYIPLDAVLAEIDKFMYGANLEADIASTGECFNEKIAEAKYQLCKQIKDKINTPEVIEICVDLGDPKGDKSAKYIIDTNTLEVKEVDLDVTIERYIEQHKSELTGYFDIRRIAKHFYDIGYFNGHIHDGDRIEHVDGRRVNVSRLQRVAKPIEEPASEELDVIAREYAGIPCDAPKDLTYCVHDKKAKYDAVLFGANWKEQQFEKKRLAYCEALTEEQAQIESDFVDKHLKENNRTPTFIDAIEYGMDLQKQQMTDGAIECYIRRNKYTKTNVLNGFDVTCDAVQKFNGGDKVKVIVTKED